MPIPSKFYVQSILSDIEGASQDIVNSPMYYTLNLCRVLFYLKEGVVSSKKEGGEWGLKALPLEYRQVIHRCLEEYSGLTDNMEFDNQNLIDFAVYMLDEITQSIQSANWKL